MPERILRAVSVPPTIFWAPYLPAAINMGLHAFLMVFGWGTLEISPLRFIVTLFVCHILLAGQGTRHPHMSTLVLCWARTVTRTKNLPRKAKVRRYAP